MITLQVELNLIQTVSQRVMLQQSSMSSLTPSCQWNPDERFSQRDLVESFSNFDSSLPQHLPLHSCFQMAPGVQLLIWTLVGYQQWLFWFHSPLSDYPWTLLQSEDEEGKSSSKKEKDEGGDSERDDEDVEVGHADIEQGDDVPRWRNVWILMQLASVPVPAGRAEAFRSTFHNPENCTQSSLIWHIVILNLFDISFSYSGQHLQNLQCFKEGRTLQTCLLSVSSPWQICISSTCNQ